MKAPTRRPLPCAGLPVAILFLAGTSLMQAGCSDKCTDVTTTNVSGAALDAAGGVSDSDLALDATWDGYQNLTEAACTRICSAMSGKVLQTDQCTGTYEDSSGTPCGPSGANWTQGDSLPAGCSPLVVCTYYSTTTTSCSGPEGGGGDKL